MCGGIFNLAARHAALLLERVAIYAWTGLSVGGSLVLALARWRAALARLPQVVMSHQRRRPEREPS